MHTAKLNTAAHDSFLMRLNALVDELSYYDNLKIRSDYSGRGMFGKICYGVTCSQDIFVRLLMEAGRQDLPLPSYDSMGLGYIVYWPQVEGDRGAPE